MALPWVMPGRMDTIARTGLKHASRLVSDLRLVVPALKAGNLARAPKGGDTDQLKAVAAGECDLAISNTYYYFRLVRSEKPDERAVAEKIGVILPNQNGRGTHVNISGAGVLKHAPHKEAAILFLEYLASDEAQNYFANGNNEWPIVPSVKSNNTALATLGKFKTDNLNLAVIGKNQPTAQKIADRSGFK